MAAKAGRAAAYWLVLLLNFTGARMEEIGQLMVCNVKWCGSIVYLRVRNEGEQDTKTEPSNRDIPLHRTLLRLGFEDYVRALPADGPLFPDLPHGKQKKLTRYFSQWLGQLLRDVGVKRPSKVGHSFRHGFSAACRAAGVQIDVEYALEGHSLGTVGARYARKTGIPLEVLDRNLQRLQFPGFPALKRVRFV
jgi:integrase